MGPVCVKFPVITKVSFICAPTIMVSATIRSCSLLSNTFLKRTDAGDETKPVGD